MHVQENVIQRKKPNVCPCLFLTRCAVTKGTQTGKRGSEIKQKSRVDGPTHTEKITTSAFGPEVVGKCTQP